MDNLTHSLAGAILGQMGLKRKTGLDMATLIIAANIPDIDAAAVLLGGHQHLAIRRGITHGPIAMILLPLLLTAGMIGFDGWQARRGERPPNRLPVHRGWLFALALIGCLSHPALDWLNNYGVRFLEPFSSHWFYGDSIFIIDIWIWIALGAGVWLSRRREKRGVRLWSRPAWISFTLVGVYIFANGMITAHAEALAARQLRAQLPAVEGQLTTVANPWPVVFICRDVLWRDAAAFGRFDYCLGQGLRPEMIDITRFNPHLMRDWQHDSLVQDAIKRDPDLIPFLFWSRMPTMQVVEDLNNARLMRIGDQRFDDALTSGRFTVSVPLEK